MGILTISPQVYAGYRVAVLRVPGKAGKFGVRPTVGALLCQQNVRRNIAAVPLVPGLPLGQRLFASGEGISKIAVKEMSTRSPALVISNAVRNLVLYIYATTFSWDSVA
jgi:hypothetical protein